MLLAELHWVRGDGKTANEHGRRAVTLVEGLPPSRSTTLVLAQRARYSQIAGLTDEAAALAQRALPMAEQLGLDELTGHVLNTIGMARVHSGDEGGMNDLERSAELAEATNSVDDIHRAYNNLANLSWHLGRLDAADDYLRRAREVDVRFGNVNGLLWLDGEDMFSRDIRGNWDEALALADKIVGWVATRPHYHVGPARVIRARIFVGRGETASALAESEQALSMARSVKDPQFLGPTLVARVRALAAAGDRAGADELVDEILRDHDAEQGWFSDLPLTLAELGREREFLAATEKAVTSTPWLVAGRAVATGDLTGAAEIYAGMGAREQEAKARLLAAERLVAEGRRAEADAQLTPALAYFRRVRAKAYIGRSEALLAASA
jgi:tetratricopeptide (TPR) repeat protein